MINQTRPRREGGGGGRHLQSVVHGLQALEVGAKRAKLDLVHDAHGRAQSEHQGDGSGLLLRTSRGPASGGPNDVQTNTSLNNKYI